MPFYASLLDGLPPALHPSLVEAWDLEDARVWLRDGLLPFRSLRSLVPDAPLAVEGRRLLRRVGVDAAGMRWVHMQSRTWRADELDQLLASEWLSDFSAVEEVDGTLRAELEAGDGGRGRYHVWYGVDGSLGLFECDRARVPLAAPVPDPPRPQIDLSLCGKSQNLRRKKAISCFTAQAFSSVLSPGPRRFGAGESPGVGHRVSSSALSSNVTAHAPGPGLLGLVPRGPLHRASVEGERQLPDVLSGVGLRVGCMAAPCASEHRLTLAVLLRGVAVHGAPLARERCEHEQVWYSLPVGCHHAC